MLDVGTQETDRWPLVVESCHSRWIFDAKNRRFRRVLKGPHLVQPVSTEWRAFDRLVFSEDSDAFLVFLDALGSRVLRSWRHVGPCARCGEQLTTEMSLEDLYRAMAS